MRQMESAMYTAVLPYAMEPQPKMPMFRLSIAEFEEAACKRLYSDRAYFKRTNITRCWTTWRSEQLKDWHSVLVGTGLIPVHHLMGAAQAPTTNDSDVDYQFTGATVGEVAPRTTHDDSGWVLGMSEDEWADWYRGAKAAAASQSAIEQRDEPVDTSEGRPGRVWIRLSDLTVSGSTMRRKGRARHS